MTPMHHPGRDFPTRPTLVFLPPPSLVSRLSPNNMLGRQSRTHAASTTRCSIPPPAQAEQDGHAGMPRAAVCQCEGPKIHTSAPSSTPRLHNLYPASALAQRHAETRERARLTGPGRRICRRTFVWFWIARTSAALRTEVTSPSPRSLSCSSFEGERPRSTRPP